ncbi:DUF805 domain-containing protein [Pantoea sp. B65]|uniref:DUF805 domain-containing protein n=1 Tax=Pantoea sp. B65 TaxID=2813359 RepID=UPI0039B42013
MNTIIESYLNCFRKYATFTGRSNRKEYSVFTIVNTVLSTVFSFIPVFNWIFGLLIFMPGIAVSVRRVHDLNKSAWWLFFPYSMIFIFGIAIGITDNIDARLLLLTLIILSCIAMSVWLLFYRGTKGRNCFGDEQESSKNHSVDANI